MDERECQFSYIIHNANEAVKHREHWTRQRQSCKKLGSVQEAESYVQIN